MAALSEPWQLGPLRVPNRVMLAPLAGIGNWFVRLQARRHGAGMAVSEMVSSHAIHYGNERTRVEMLRIHPDERAPSEHGLPGLVSIQLFGQDPAVMRSAAAFVASQGVDLIDLNMGCPVPKVCRNGAGAALIDDPDRAVLIARAAREGSGLPVTVKIRSGRRPGDTSGFELARRLVQEAGVAAIAFHPRAATVHHKGFPDYDLAARLVETLDAPVILSGGLADADRALAAWRHTGAAAIMLARGSLGNPWLFERLLGRRDSDPAREEVLQELDWIIDAAALHLGPERAARYLRKFYPWYLPRLGLDRRDSQPLQERLQLADRLDEARELLHGASTLLPVAV